MANILRHNLRLNILDPAVDIINALFVQHVAVSIKQTFSLLSRRILQFFPLLPQLVQSRIHNTRQIWLLALDSLSITDQFLQLVLVRLNLRLKCLQQTHSHAVLAAYIVQRLYMSQVNGSIETAEWIKLVVLQEGFSLN